MMSKRQHKMAEGWMLSKHDYDLLKYYSKPRIVLPKDKDDVRRLASNHLLARGMDASDKKIRPTAHLTNYGADVLCLEQKARGDLPRWQRFIAKLSIL